MFKNHGRVKARRSSEDTDFRVIFALFMVHFIGDFYMSFISPLLPVLADKLSLSLAQVGMVTGMVVIMAFIVQPSVGYLSDRYQTRFFVLGGPLMSAIFIPLFGWAGGFISLLAFAMLGSIGQSMFHPQAAGMVPVYAGRRLGLSMALFILGGTVAFGVGPLFVTLFITRFGLSALPWSALLGIFIVGVMMVMIPKPESERLSDLGILASIKEVLYPVRKELSILLAIIVMRTFVVNSIMTFTPVLFSREGFGLVSIGGITSTLTMAGAISGLLAGFFADRIGYKPVFLISYLLTPPCLYLFLQLKGNWVFLGSFMAGFFSLATLPLATAMAQTLVRTGKSLVASLMMGLAFGIGGLLTPLTGKMADIFSIRQVLGVVIWFPLLAMVLIKYLPETGIPDREKVTDRV